MFKIMSQVITHSWPFRFHTCIFLHLLKITINIKQCLMSSAGVSRSQVPWVGAPKTEVPRLWISVCSWHFSLWAIFNEKKIYNINIGAGRRRAGMVSHPAAAQLLLPSHPILLQPNSHSHPFIPHGISNFWLLPSPPEQHYLKGMIWAPIRKDIVCSLHMW